MRAPKKVRSGIPNPVKLPSQIAQDPCDSQQKKQSTETPIADSGSASVSSGGNSRKVSPEDIELVQNLIERCLQLYMNQGEVVRTLLNRARIDPGFTTLVWHKLEEENPDFFRAYYIKLKLKRQIIMFNSLLEHQFHLMKYRPQPTIPAPLVQNGSHQMPVNNLPIDYPVMPTSEHANPTSNEASSCHLVHGIPAPSLFQHIRGNIPNETDNTGKRSTPPATGRGELSDMASSPASLVSSGHFPFTPSEISGMDVDSSALHTSFPSNVGAGSSMDSLSMEHISWDFSISDLPAADLTHFQDIGELGNYSGSPFLPSDSELFLESSEQDEIVNEYFADNIAESPCSEMEEKP